MLVGDDIRENMERIPSALVLRTAKSIVTAHPRSLGCLMADQQDIEEASAVFSNSILGHIRYVREAERTWKKRRVQGAGEGSEDEDSPDSKLPKMSAAECYALASDRDLPNNLLLGETPEKQETSRLLLVRMSNDTIVNMTSVKKIMVETYYTQRIDINSSLNMEQLLERWPYLGEHSVLQKHFEILMNITVAESTAKSSDLFNKMEDYFLYEASKKRRGSVKDIPADLKSILKRYKNDTPDPSKLYIMVVLCCMKLMQIKEDNIFIRFEENTSFDEVQASDLLPSHPVIAVLGRDIQSNPRSFVVVGKRIISEESVSVAKAINILLMCYFVFKLKYPLVASPILHFLQRQVFNINNKGTKTERSKTEKGYVGAPPDTPKVLLTLMHKFKQHHLEWN